MYDAMTGNLILDITSNQAQVVPVMFGYSVQVTGPFSIPSMTLFEDDHGGLCGYYVNTTTSFVPGPTFFETTATLCLWNSTADINLNNANYAGGPNVVDDWMWRPGEVAQDSEGYTS